MSNIRDLVCEYPLIHSAIGYGTSGFRTEGTVLIPIAMRIGIFTVLKSICEFVSKDTQDLIMYMGIEITASHNPYKDNGLKIVDHNGMLSPSWEPLAVKLANAKTADEIQKIFDDTLDQHGCPGKFNYVSITSNIHEFTQYMSDLKIIIHTGRDTRATGLDVMIALKKGIELFKPMAITIDHGLVTTPAMHFIIKYIDNKFKELPTIYDDSYVKQDQLRSKQVDQPILTYQQQLDIVTGVTMQAYKLYQCSVILNAFQIKSGAQYTHTSITQECISPYQSAKKGEMYKDNQAHETTSLQNISFNRFSRQHSDVMSDMALTPIHPDFKLQVNSQNHFNINTASRNRNTASRTPSVYSHSQCRAAQESVRHIIVDCANGVGAISLQSLIDSLAIISIPFKFYLVNTNIKDRAMLNHHCGADYSCRYKKPSDAMLSVWKTLVYEECYPTSHISMYVLDGDADRCVSFYVPIANNDGLSRINSLGEWHTNHRQLSSTSLSSTQNTNTGCNYSSPLLLDGDHLLVLYAEFIHRMAGKVTSSKPTTLGAVQTAYTNGASTEYIRQLDAYDIKCVATGVKHLHPGAEEYDIGVYFEPNGHGNCIFSTSFLRHLAYTSYTDSITNYMNSTGHRDTHNSCATTGYELDSISTSEFKRVNEFTCSSIENNTPSSAFLKFSQLFNEACGDGIMNIFATEFALLSLNYSHDDWYRLYTAYPATQLQVPIPNKVANSCNIPLHEYIFRNLKLVSNNTRILSPASLQEMIDSHIKSISNANSDELSCYRAFVRPSGTEALLRIYAEGPRQCQTDLLAESIAKDLTEYLYNI